jgi:spermidine/putrescine transport system substrate-binding protein
MLKLKSRLRYVSLGLGLCLGAFCAKADEIRVLNWKGLGTDEAWSVKLFEERTGTKVVYDYFTSEQEMLTKLRTNPGVYDVVLVNMAQVNQAASENLIQSLNGSDFKNFADLTPALRDHPNLLRNGSLFGIAWTWGVTSMVINTTTVQSSPTSIQVLWDPRYKGRISLRDDPVDAMFVGAIATGQNPSTPSAVNLTVVEEKLKGLKPQISAFWSSENEWNQMMAAKEFDIATYWSGSAARSKTRGLPIALVIPAEGAIGFVDSLAIPATSRNPGAAKKFIDWMIDPEFYVRWDTQNGAPASANAKALQQLPETSFNRAVLGDPAVAQRVFFKGPLTDEFRRDVLKMWQGLKTFYQQ